MNFIPISFCAKKKKKQDHSGFSENVRIAVGRTVPRDTAFRIERNLHCASPPDERIMNSAMTDGDNEDDEVDD